jgi:histone H2A
MKDINFKIYISQILRQVHPDTQISADVKELISSLLNNVGNKIASEAVFLVGHCGAKTVSQRAVESSVKLNIPSNMARHALIEGRKACIKYEGTNAGSTRKPITAAKRAGIQIPPSRARKLIENNLSKGFSISQLGCVYLAAVLEYLSAEILELSGNAARDNRRSTINSQHLQHAIRSDDELDKLLRDVAIPGGGILPNIHAILLKKKSAKKKKKKKK